MEDSEARYLIDQFNKYASSTISRVVPVYSLLALIMSCAAFIIALLSNPGLVSGIPPLVGLALVVVFAILSLVLIGRLYGLTYRILNEHESNKRRLIALDNYRSKYRYLPDGLTFEKIVTSTPEELEELLASRQPEKSFLS